jgi:(1->4)-alpha-D-glucan 1-alpha-D-glucosylmutase
VGAWPERGPDASFVARMQAYVVKAAREAKQITSWVAPNERYEAGLGTYIERLLDRSVSARFLDSFDAFAQRAALLGALNSLTQTALKIIMPGVPAFVDPDNRRAVDFAARISALAEVSSNSDWDALVANWQSGRIKLALTHQLLAVRHQFHDVLTHGDYRPLQVTGAHRDEMIAFARTSGRIGIILIAARFFHRATDGGRCWPPRASWDATVAVKEFSALQNLLSQNQAISGPSLEVCSVFGAMPVAVLQGSCARARHVASTPPPALLAATV